MAKTNSADEDQTGEVKLWPLFLYSDKHVLKKTENPNTILNMISTLCLYFFFSIFLPSMKSSVVDKMRLVTTDQVIPKPVCLATETS